MQLTNADLTLLSTACDIAAAQYRTDAETLADSPRPGMERIAQAFREHAARLDTLSYHFDNNAEPFED